jgi:hypothetical protein
VQVGPLHTVARRFLALLLEVLEAPIPPVPGLYLLYKYVSLLQVIFPPGVICVLFLEPTAPFFLNKNPFVLPNQNCPFELVPIPDIYIYLLLDIKNF